MSGIIWFLSLLLISKGKGDFPVYLDDGLEPMEVAETRDTTESEYRLPLDVIPLEYDIDIVMNFNATDTSAAYSYDGRVSIIIQPIEEDINQITLHANVDLIRGVSLYNSDGVPLLLNPAQPFLLEPTYHFLRVNTAENLVQNDNYTLTIDYYSTMNEGPLRRGIWRGHYLDSNGVRKNYATTHFQPYNARQAFPCWDEPMFKAVFKLHITRPVEYSNVFSNTAKEFTEILANGNVKDHFLSTPKMSSYLLTLLVSESFVVIAEDTSFTPPVRIIGRSNTVGMGDEALIRAVKMTEFFDQYLSIPYSSLHPNLLNDHISSPDWASAGTENWGMVSYREMYLTLSPNETLMSTEHYAGTLISHELAHKWFGNLITCFWWSNTWINEGFASYFGYYATQQMFPEYEHMDHFNTRYLQTSLSTDQAASTVALNHEVNTPAQVTGHFGTISYSKGAAFLRMLSDMITEETFRKACQYFLITNAYEPADQGDLLEAFTEAIAEDGSLAQYQNFNLTNFYYTWVDEPGFPILEVDIDYATGVMNLKQERFFITASTAPTGQIYPIPITYSTASNPDFTQVRPVYMMESATATLNKPAGTEWVIFNNLQHGHYRVNYNEENWELIAEALLNDSESIHFANRAQIVDDIFALMRSERMTYDFGFKILRFLRYETNHHVWEPAITGYTWIRNRLRYIPDSAEAFDSHVLSYMEHVIETLGFDGPDNESKTNIMTREMVLHFACMLGHEGCVQQSRERFIAMRDSDTWVSPKIRRNVYVNGIREGGEEDFTFLFSKFLANNYASDQLEMLRGLGSTKDPTLLTRFLELTLTDLVRTHDKVNAFNYALLGNKESSYVALQFVKNNVEDIREVYQATAPNNPVHTVFSNLASYLDESGLAEYETWLQTTQVGTSQYATGISAIASARTNIEWGLANADIITAAVRDGSTKTIVSFVMLISLVLTVQIL